MLKLTYPVPEDAQFYRINSRKKKTYYTTIDNQLYVFNRGINEWELDHNNIDRNTLIPVDDASTKSEELLQSLKSVKSTFPINDETETSITVSDIVTKEFFVSSVGKYSISQIYRSHASFVADTNFHLGEAQYIVEYDALTKTWSYTEIDTVMTIGALYFKSLKGVKGLVSFLNSKNLTPSQIVEY